MIFDNFTWITFKSYSKVHMQVSRLQLKQAQVLHISKSNFFSTRDSNVLMLDKFESDFESETCCLSWS